MSVHGEYSRALETLIACTRALSSETREDWPKRFEEARVERNRDLSVAAGVALAALDDLDAIDLRAPPLSAAKTQLRAHCGVILGFPQ